MKSKNGFSRCGELYAYFENSYQKALMAFTLNRLINDGKKARKVLDALIEANKGMWPELK